MQKLGDLSLDLSLKLLQRHPVFGVAQVDCLATLAMTGLG